MAELKFKRVIIKLSGEALAGETGMGIDHAKLGAVVDQIAEVKNSVRKSVSSSAAATSGAADKPTAK